MRSSGLEPPRGVSPTRPSTLRVYQFRHERRGREYSPARRAREMLAGTALCAPSVIVRVAVGRLRVFVRFAISIPQYARDSRFDDDAFRAHLRRVEELGVFESGWVQEQVIGASGSLAPLQTLTYAAACTEQLRLGCAVFVLPAAQPAAPGQGDQLAGLPQPWPS